MNIGLAIKQLREDAGFSQQELADKSGIGRAYICHIENGNRESRHSTLSAIGQALGVPLPAIYVKAIEEDDINAGEEDKFREGKDLILKSLI